MILGKDIHPERKLYFLGGLILKILESSYKKEIEFLHAFQKINETKKVSISVFIMTLDWLYILGAISYNDGFIKKCS